MATTPPVRPPRPGPPRAGCFAGRWQSQGTGVLHTPAAGPAVVNVYINYEKKFAFVECRTVDETSNAMGLDGIMFEGVSVRVRRPNDYNPAAAAGLGPANPSPNLNLAAIGLTVRHGAEQASSSKG